MECRYYCVRHSRKNRAKACAYGKCSGESDQTRNKTTICHSNPIIMEMLSHHTHHSEETLRRSVMKTISYRVVILILDFVAIYFSTGQIKIAVGFMIVSNIYTTLGYFFHERIWDKIKWGKLIYKKNGEKL